MKTVTLSQFLTEREIRQARVLYNAKTPNYARAVCDKIIAPNIARINHDLGQENVPMFLAYAVEYAMSQASPHD
jgi:hypothetical protein